MSKKNQHITVLKGGTSAEREVSLKTGSAVAKALVEAGYEITDLTIEGIDFKIPLQTDLIFNCLHGGFGENGELQHRLNNEGILFTGSDEEASRLTIDKIATKEVFNQHGIPTPESQVIKRAEELTLSLPVIIKPPCEGSTIGVTIVSRPENLEQAVTEALKYGETALVETFIQGPELTVAILDGKALPVIEIRPKEGMYDYQNKYTPGRTEYLCPAPIDPEITKKVQELAVKAHQVTGCGVYSRVDIMLSKKDQIPYVLEINTTPGFTGTSLVPKAAAAAGMTFPELCDTIVQLTLQAAALKETGGARA